jgi:hypothetical protein
MALVHDRLLKISDVLGSSDSCIVGNLLLQQLPATSFLSSSEAGKKALLLLLCVVTSVKHCA